MIHTCGFLLPVHVEVMVFYRVPSPFFHTLPFLGQLKTLALTFSKLSTFTAGLVTLMPSAAPHQRPVSLPARGKLP